MFQSHDQWWNITCSCHIYYIILTHLKYSLAFDSICNTFILFSIVPQQIILMRLNRAPESNQLHYINRIVYVILAAPVSVDIINLHEIRTQWSNVSPRPWSAQARGTAEKSLGARTRWDLVIYIYYTGEQASLTGHIVWPFGISSCIFETVIYNSLLRFKSAQTEYDFNYIFGQMYHNNISRTP
jgi:hypothetical protein